jgi:hypothetical protein
MLWRPRHAAGRAPAQAGDKRAEAWGGRTWPSGEPDFPVASDFPSSVYIRPSFWVPSTHISLLSWFPHIPFPVAVSFFLNSCGPPLLILQQLPFSCLNFLLKRFLKEQSGLCRRPWVPMLPIIYSWVTLGMSLNLPEPGISYL